MNLLLYEEFRRHFISIFLLVGITVFLCCFMTGTGDEAEYKLLPSGPANGTDKDAKGAAEPEVTHPNS